MSLIFNNVFTKLFTNSVHFIWMFFIFSWQIIRAKYYLLISFVYKSHVISLQFYFCTGGGGVTLDYKDCMSNYYLPFITFFNQYVETCVDGIYTNLRFLFTVLILPVPNHIWTLWIKWKALTLKLQTNKLYMLDAIIRVFCFF